MARVKMKDVLLERDWSGHKAGVIVTVEDYTAESMEKKNYGHIITAAEKKKLEPPKEVKVESADAPPPVENAMANPKVEDKPKPPGDKKGGAG